MPLSAGILMWRRGAAGVEVLLVRFGGPWWRGKDKGAWSMPKGLVEKGEDIATCARREFEEELGTRPQGELVPLGRIRQKGGKQVEALALEGDFDPSEIASNRFTMEWPPRSGAFRSFPEVEEARWFALPEAREMMLPSQLPLLDALDDVT